MVHVSSASTVIAPAAGIVYGRDVTGTTAVQVRFPADELAALDELVKQRRAADTSRAWTRSSLLRALVAEAARRKR